MSTSPANEALAVQVLELLNKEGRPMHTGAIAGVLGVFTHQVHSAMHHPYQTGKVRFTSSDGWSMMDAPARVADGKTEPLA